MSTDITSPDNMLTEKQVANLSLGGFKARYWNTSLGGMTVSDLGFTELRVIQVVEDSVVGTDSNLGVVGLDVGGVNLLAGTYIHSRLTENELINLASGSLILYGV